MSARLYSSEYTADPTNIQDVDEYTPTYAHQPYCQYCYQERTNTQGMTSLAAKAWFCSGLCYQLHMHDNKLVFYTDDIVKALNTARKECRREEYINRRRAKVNKYYFRKLE